MYARYFHAQVVRERVWFLTGCLRSCDNLALERTIDKDQSILEFFVPVDAYEDFVRFIESMERVGAVTWWKELPNRLADQDAVV